MLALRIALRYLFSRKSHSAVNIISLISAAGIVVATAAIVIIMSVFNGFSDIARNKLSLLDADYAVSRADGRPIAGADSLCRVLSAIPGITAATPTLRREALAMIGDRQMPVTAVGLSDTDIHATRLDTIIADGDASLTLYGRPCALLSPGVAIGLDTRNATQGDLILYEPRRLGRVNPGNPMGAFRTDTLITQGIFVTGDSDLDDHTLIVPLTTMRRILEYRHGEADALRLYTGGGTRVSPGDITRLLPGGPDGWIVAGRIAQHAESYRMISIEKWLTFCLLAFVLVIASFNIISTMTMLIIEKRPNMRILRAMGAPQRLIDRIFVWQSALITVTGGLAGIILGVILCLIQQYGHVITLQASDPTLLTIDAYPVTVRPADLLTVAAVIAAIAAVSGLLTTRTLHRQDPDDR